MSGTPAPATQIAIYGEGLRAAMRAHLVVPLLLLTTALAGCHETPLNDEDLPIPTDPTETPTDPPGTTPGGPVTFSEDFETDGLAGWAKDADVPDDPNEPGEKVDWNITISQDQARSGTQAVEYSIDGRQDDGTIWIVKRIDVEAGQSYQANVSAWAWSASESFNTIANLVMYLGTSEPTGEGSFPQSGQSGDIEGADAGGLREPLNRAEGWEEYTFEWTTPELESDVLFVAVGITVVWETHMTYFVDDVQVDLEPQ